MAIIPNKFNEGEIVYWCASYGHERHVKYGRVADQIGSTVYIDYLSKPEDRTINGVPIEEFKETSKYRKLPKGWCSQMDLFELGYRDMITPIDERLESEGINFNSKDILIDNPKTVQRAFEYGYLVRKEDTMHRIVPESEITRDGFRVRMKALTGRDVSRADSLRDYTTIEAHKLKTIYKDAYTEVQEQKDELERQANLSYEEWSIEQIQKTIDRWYASNRVDEEDKKKHEEFIFGLGNIEDVEVRVSGGELQWKYWKKKRWANIEV